MGIDDYQQITNNEDYKLASDCVNSDAKAALDVLNYRLSQKTFNKMVSNMFSDIAITYPSGDPISVKRTGDVAHVMDNRAAVAYPPKSIKEAIRNFISNVKKLSKVAILKLLGH